MKAILTVLAVFAICGCSAKPDFNSIVDAITRYKDLGTRETQLEARKAFDEARRKDAPTIITDYYYAVDAAVQIGDKESVERARICEAEIKLDSTTVAGTVKHGDCRRLAEESVQRTLDSAERTLKK